MRRVLIIGAAVAWVAAVPALARAAGPLTLSKPCYVTALDSTEPVVVSGGGFTPGQSVTFAYSDGSSAGSAVADGAGNVAARVKQPALPAGVPEDVFTLNATDSANPSNTSRTMVRVARLRVTSTPASARVSSRVVYRVNGLQPVGAPVYVHVRFRGHRVRTFRMGVAKGPCGTVTRRMKLLPVPHPLRGTWLMQFDRLRRYSRATRPAIRLRVIVLHAPLAPRSR